MFPQQPHGVFNLRHERFTSSFMRVCMQSTQIRLHILELLLQYRGGSRRLCLMHTLNAGLRGHILFCLTTNMKKNWNSNTKRASSLVFFQQIDAGETSCSAPMHKMSKQNFQKLCPSIDQRRPAKISEYLHAASSAGTCTQKHATWTPHLRNFSQVPNLRKSRGLAQAPIVADIPATAARTI